MCSKVTEYLTLTGYVHQGQELWKQADILMGQYRGKQQEYNNINNAGGVYKKLRSYLIYEIYRNISI